MKKKFGINTYKTIEIPHLRYTIHFIDMSKLQGVDKKGGGYTCIMGERVICIFMENIAESVKNIKLIPWFAHEIIHALAIMCEDMGMQIEDEKEHMAYLMHYILETVIN